MITNNITVKTISYFNFVDKKYIIQSSIARFPLSLAFISYFLQSMVFILFIEPYTMDPDINHGLTQFQFLLGNLLNYIGIESTVKFLQFFMLFISISLLTLLYIGKLIEKSVLMIYLTIPFSAYLAIKIKLEFFVPILSIIKIDLKIKYHMILLMLLFLLYLITQENNLIILILFRIIYLLMSLANPFLIFIKIMVATIIVDKAFDILANTPLAIVLSRFYWTRDIVNPEYSIIESIGVFVSSFHLSINAIVDWKFHLIFSGPLFLYLSYKFIKEYKNLDKKLLYSFISTYFIFTHITHAFQNARYYYFYIHILTKLINRDKELIILLILGWFHSLSLILINHIIFS